MNLFNQIISKLTPVSESDIILSDKFTSSRISYDLSNFKTFNESAIQELVEFVCKEDSFSLQIKVGENDAIIFDNNKNNFHQFCNLIIEERRLTEDESVYFKFEIKKNTENSINIYSFNSFIEFWSTLSTIDILKLLKKYQNKFGVNSFIFQESEINEFYSKNISFTTTAKLPNSHNSYISENCHFGNIEEFPFNAHYFYLEERPNENNIIVETLDRLSLIFSIICIFDITSIKESNLYYKLNGYKSFEGNIDIDTIDLKLTTIYYRIFEWIYSEKGNISDKIGLSRNIISLTLKNKSIQISDSVFISIQSGYKSYLQDNITQYVEIRNKIMDELSWVSQKASEIITNYLNNYQKSIFTFLSFFISVFILRFLKDSDITNVFSKEVTIFSLTFLGLSIIYLFFSLWNLKLDKKRLTRKYENIKNRYTDLLETKDIEKILKNDDEFKYEISFINKRKNNYTILWILTIIILISIVLSVSNYINWFVVSMILNTLSFF